MLNINFVPDDYVQNSESRRTNLIYLVLFVIVMAGLGGSFITIKIRQRALNTKERFVNEKLMRAKESIKQFEELQAKFKIMSKTALTTAELLEPVPRSVLLASLTNNLPMEVSLLRVDLVQKEPKKTGVAAAASKYQPPKNENEAASQMKTSQEQQLETCIDIEGISPSDLQVASYIEQLSGSALLDNVALVESKEHKIDNTVFRRFKLTAMLKKEVHLTREDIERIRKKCAEAMRVF